MQSKQGIEMDKSIEGRINRVKIDETASSLSAIAKKLYVRKSLLIHLMQHYRPYICPFEEIIKLNKVIDQAASYWHALSQTSSVSSSCPVTIFSRSKA